ncbi:glycosyltransferase [Bacillus cereus]
MKIKITYICESIGGGVRKHLVDILLNIDLQKYDISVIYGGERIDEVFLATKSTLEKKGVVFFQIQSMKRELSIKNDILCLKEIRKILKEIKPDIVHCHSSKAGAIGRIAARTCNIKKIFYTPHAYISQNPFISKKKGILFLGIERILGIISSKNIHVSKGEELFALDHNIINKKNLP